jgi:hypothetical protein
MIINGSGSGAHSSLPSYHEEESKLEITKIDAPLNASERYLYGINIRLDAIIHMLSTFIEAYAKQNNIATTDNQIKEEVKITRKTKK